MLKKMLRSSIAPVLLFALAAGLIGYGGIKAVQAAPRIQSEVWGAQVQLSSIATALVENEVEVVGDDQLLQATFREANGLDEGYTNFKVGQKYAEVLKAKNTGVIDEYVRVTVYKYWADAEGKELKDTKLNPGLIKLGFVTDNGWTIDEAASTEERTVLYYTNPHNEHGWVVPGELTNEFVNSITIDPAARKIIEGETYKYDGTSFYIKATVDAVQTHNGQEAMTGAWGRTN